MTGFAAKKRPRLALDVVPTGRSGELQVLFERQPLPTAPFGVAMRAGREKKCGSDARVPVRNGPPWQGRYVIEAVHADRR